MTDVSALIQQILQGQGAASRTESGRRSSGGAGAFRGALLQLLDGQGSSASGTGEKQGQELLRALGLSSAPADGSVAKGHGAEAGAPSTGVASDEGGAAGENVPLEKLLRRLVLELKARGTNGRAGETKAENANGEELATGTGSEAPNVSPRALRILERLLAARADEGISPTSNGPSSSKDGSSGRGSSKNAASKNAPQTDASPKNLSAENPGSGPSSSSARTAGTAAAGSTPGRTTSPSSRASGEGSSGSSATSSNSPAGSSSTQNADAGGSQKTAPNGASPTSRSATRTEGPRAAAVRTQNQNTDRPRAQRAESSARQTKTGTDGRGRTGSSAGESSPASSTSPSRSTGGSGTKPKTGPRSGGGKTPTTPAAEGEKSGSTSSQKAASRGDGTSSGSPKTSSANSSRSNHSSRPNRASRSSSSGPSSTRTPVSGGGSDGVPADRAASKTGRAGRLPDGPSSAERERGTGLSSRRGARSSADSRGSSSGTSSSTGSPPNGTSSKSTRRAGGRHHTDASNSGSAPADGSDPEGRRPTPTRRGRSSRSHSGTTASDGSAARMRTGEEQPHRTSRRTNTRTTPATREESTARTESGSSGKSAPGSRGGTPSGGSSGSGGSADGHHQNGSGTPARAADLSLSGPSSDSGLPSMDDLLSFSSEIRRAGDETSSRTGTSLSGNSKSGGVGGSSGNQSVNGAFLRAAWRRALKNSSARQYAQKNGWHVLRMNLDEKSGQMTVRARQKQDGVSVSVGLSDPQLRSMVSAHSDRLEAALRAEYDADVDFSLSAESRDGGQNRETDRRDAPNRPGHEGGLAAAEGAEAGEERRAGRYSLNGSYEWIG